MNKGLSDVLYFLNVVAKILTRQEEFVNKKGLLDGIFILQGEIHFDHRATIADILHEAGHIAIMPKRYRHLLTGNVAKGVTEAWDDLRRLDLISLDDPLMRALLQCSDPEATAWAWAAGMHIGLRPEQIIPDSDNPLFYGGDAAGVRFAHTLAPHYQPLGAHGLAAAGFCQVGMTNPHNPLPKYPKLAFWTQEL